MMERSSEDRQIAYFYDEDHVVVHHSNQGVNGMPLTHLNAFSIRRIDLSLSWQSA